MAITPATEPSSVNAGDTVRWTRSLPDYPASAGWVLAYQLVNATSRITLTGTASGDDHLIQAAATGTASWISGDYAWRAQVSKAGGEVFTVGEGRITVRPSFASGTQDTRSQARQALDAVNAYLANPNNLAASEYQIAGRQLRRHSLSDLWRHRDRLQDEVLREEAAARLAAGLPSNSRIFVRFGA